MKTVYANQELFHIYASGTQSFGRSHNGNVYFEENTLYSYGRHFPLSICYQGKYLLNSETYSVTTSKHQSQLFYALRHRETLAMPALGVVAAIIDLKKRGDKSQLISECTAYCKSIAREIEEAQGKRDRARKDWSKNSWQNHIDHLQRVAEFIWHDIAGRKSDPIAGALRQNRKETKARLLENIARDKAQAANAMQAARQFALRAIKRFKRAKQSETNDLEYCWHLLFNSAQDDMITMSRKFTSINAGNREMVTKAMQRDLKAIEEANQRASDKYLLPLFERGRREYEALRNISDQEKIERFHKRELHHISTLQTVCRVNGDVVETSRGARVPLDDALILFNAARVCRTHGKATGAANGQRLGAYVLDWIDTQGNAKIGCHHLTWAAIEDCARRYMPQLLHPKRALGVANDA